MLWQDLIFVFGSLLTVVFLTPTVRNVDARIPLGTSVPKMALGVVYALTFASLGMTLAAVGVFGTGIMWALVARYRSPGGQRFSPGRRVAPETNGQATASGQVEQKQRQV
ncbi:hypothetical protein [Natronorubrum halalkaliphilum]|uniref:hypothetical protein n=1 Tax=Natronorubrum halalkaliphilum TaxID=2691917 RepID=UPI001F2DCE60|nr:hypothetical protein [Natronorubrum halalkaliphilum]